MEEDIDLRYYISVLAKWWKWIMILTIAAATVAGAISFLSPPTYEAIATLVVTQARYLAEFDPRFEAVEVEPRYEAFSSLVKTGDLEEQVIGALEGETSEELTVGNLQRMATVSHGDDPSVIFLKVRHRDPDVAALVANTWAQLYVARVREIYGRTEVEESRLEAELHAGEENLIAAEEALVEFQTQSQITMLEHEVEAKSQALAAHLGLRERLQLLAADAESLRDRLALGSSEAPTLGDHLAVLLLEVSSLSSWTTHSARASEDQEIPAVSAPSAALPLQLSLEGFELGQTSSEEQQQVLDNLISSLMGREEAINGAIESLSLELPVLTAELERQRAEKSRLTLNRDLAQETYGSLSRKLDEARVAAQLEEGVVSIASPAYEPTKPVASKRMFNIAVAGLSALVLGGLGAFGIEYLKGGEEGEPRGSLPQRQET